MIYKGMISPFDSWYLLSAAPKNHRHYNRVRRPSFLSPPLLSDAGHMTKGGETNLFGGWGLVLKVLIANAMFVIIFT